MKGGSIFFSFRGSGQAGAGEPYNGISGGHTSSKGTSEPWPQTRTPASPQINPPFTALFHHPISRDPRIPKNTKTLCVSYPARWAPSSSCPPRGRLLPISSTRRPKDQNPAPSQNLKHSKPRKKPKQRRRPRPSASSAGRHEAGSTQERERNPKMTERANLVSIARATRNQTGTHLPGRTRPSFRAEQLLCYRRTRFSGRKRVPVIPDRSRGSGLCGILIRVSGVPDRPTGRFSSETLL